MRGGRFHLQRRRAPSTSEWKMRPDNEVDEPFSTADAEAAHGYRSHIVTFKLKL